MPLNQSFSQDANGDINNATFQDKAGTGTIAALNATVVAITNGASTCFFNISGTWVASLIFEGQDGNGNWNSTLGVVIGQGNVTAFVTTNAPLAIPCGGFNQVRVRASAYTSGTVTVNYNVGSGNIGSQVFNLIPGSLNAQVTGNVASGSADSGNGVKVSGVANTGENSLPSVTNGQRVDLQSDLNGRLFVNAVPIDGSKATYAASATVATAAAATDVFVMTGSATKTIRITNFYVSMTATAATTVIGSLIRRSAANTGGTSTAPAAVTYDTNNAAATATVAAYTANPTALGAAVGSSIAVLKIAANTTATVGNDITLDFGDRPAQAIVLRGTSQLLALNFNATTVTGGSASISIEWTEE